MKPSDIENMKLLEYKMDKYDEDCIAVSTNRNALESYVLDGQDQFSDNGKYGKFMTTDEKNSFMNNLLKMDDFLCKDNFDQRAQVYADKLSKLSSISNIYVQRYTEW